MGGVSGRIANQGAHFDHLEVALCGSADVRTAAVGHGVGQELLLTVTQGRVVKVRHRAGAVRGLQRRGAIHIADRGGPDVVLGHVEVEVEHLAGVLAFCETYLDRLGIVGGVDH